MIQRGPTTAWPPLNPIFGRIRTDSAAVTQTNRASQLLLFWPLLLTAPIFAFVCGLLLAAAG